MKRIVIFASGNGTNTENLITFFRRSNKVGIVKVLTNNPQSRVIKRCKTLEVPTVVFNREALTETREVLDVLLISNPDLIVLAGFLLKVPRNILDEFPNKIINLHPSLLPKYGGKGMYGQHVHEAVIANKEYKTGITIHYVNAQYDEGAIIFQAACPVEASDTVEAVANKVHKLEKEHLPNVVERLLFYAP